MSIDFIIKYKDKLDWNKISYIYKFESEQYSKISTYVVKKNNLLYLDTQQIIKRFNPNVQIIDDEYIVGYIDFTQSNMIYCTNSSNTLKRVEFSIDGKRMSQIFGIIRNQTNRMKILTKTLNIMNLIV